MTVHRLERVQLVPEGLDAVWAFFTDPCNLALLTPPDLGFILTCDPPAAIYSGLIVTYRVRPFLGLPVPWVSEISDVDPGRRFTDVQRFGPYRSWRHEHLFNAVAAGVEVRDVVQYSLPFGRLGDVIDKLVVAPRLRRIFEYRRRALALQFGSPGSIRSSLGARREP